MIEIEKKRSVCALANGLEILGDRWSLLIIRDLMLTNRREFGHFLDSDEGISTNILSDRLERLVSSGILTKKPHPNHGKKFVYELTDLGVALAPAMIELILWSLKAIDGTRIPGRAWDLLRNDREKLLTMIAARQPLYELDLG